MRLSRLGLLFAVALVPLVLWAALPVLSAGQQGRAARLNEKIDQKRRAIEQKKGKERVLSTTVQRYSRKIGVLQSSITVLQRKQVDRCLPPQGGGALVPCKQSRAFSPICKTARTDGTA